MVKSINPTGDAFPQSTADEFYVYNGRLYFRADNGVHGIELWVTDGTESMPK